METELGKIAATPMASVATARRPGDSVPVDSAAELRSGFAGIVFLLLLGLLATILVSLSVGAIHVPISAILASILERRPLTEIQHTILFAIRLPRVLASALVGAALAVSGLMFQGLFRNPMADPYIIGASGGAALGACIGIVFLSQYEIFGFSATALLAFAGSVVTMAIVYSLARTHGPRTA